MLTMSRRRACIAGLVRDLHHRTGGDFCSSRRYAQVHLRKPGLVLAGAAVAFQELGKRLRFLFQLLVPLRVAHHRHNLWRLCALVLGWSLLLLALALSRVSRPLPPEWRIGLQ